MDSRAKPGAGQKISHLYDDGKIGQGKGDKKSAS